MNKFHSSGFRVRKDLISKWSYKSQLRAYRTGSKQDWNSPNSTDVHSIKLINNLPAYLAKYCVKNDGYRKLKGKLWGLSTSLSQIKGATDVVDSSYSEELSLMAQDKRVRVKYEDHYTIIFITPRQLKEFGYMLLFSLIARYVLLCQKKFE